MISSGARSLWKANSQDTLAGQILMKRLPRGKRFINICPANVSWEFAFQSDLAPDEIIVTYVPVRRLCVQWSRPDRSTPTEDQSRRQAAGDVETSLGKKSLRFPSTFPPLVAQNLALFAVQVNFA